MSEAAGALPGVPYGAAKAKREADDARVLGVIADRPAREWTVKHLLDVLTDLNKERVRGALTRLTMQGQLRQENGGQENHYHWRLRTPLQEG